MDGLTLGSALTALAPSAAAPVTELAPSAVAVGTVVLPAGGLAAVVVTALVALGVVGDATPGGRRTAFTLGVVGLVFLLVFAVEVVVLSRPLSFALPVAVLVALGFGLYAFVRATGAE